MRSKKEAIKHFNEFVANYKKDPKTPERVEDFQRKHSNLTEKDLLKTFTI